MSAQKPKGPGLVSMTCLGIGIGLLFLGLARLSVHTLWEVPLGALIAGTAIGNMVAR